MECCNHIFIKRYCFCHNCNGNECDVGKQTNEGGKMKRWNLKRLKAGVYTDPNGRFYALKSDKYWSVGYIENHSFQHVADVKSFALARYWIKERAVA